MAADFGRNRIPFHHRLTALALITAGPLFAAGGCLSFGGGTTHVHDNPETEQHLVNLESRVQVLESMLARPPELLPSQATLHDN